MSGISFTHPTLLALALVPLAVAAVQMILGSRRQTSVPLSAFEWIPRRRDPRVLHHVGRILRLLGVFCLVILIAGPVTAYVETTTVPAPSALIIALDRSSSMTAEDFRPSNRLEEAKRSLGEFVGTMPDLELGLIQFAGLSQLLVPVTNNHQAVLDTLDGIRPAQYEEDGTAIGSAVASAVNRLRTGNLGRRMILLITDGVNNRGPLAPLDSARIAKALGIRIFVVGIGTNEVSRFFVPTAEGSVTELRARIEIDDGALEMLSMETGGSYRRVRNSQELHEALTGLIPAETTTTSRPVFRRNASTLRLLAALALALLSLEFVIRRFIHCELPG